MSSFHSSYRPLPTILPILSTNSISNNASGDIRPPVPRRAAGVSNFLAAILLESQFLQTIYQGTLGIMPAQEDDGIESHLETLFTPQITLDQQMSQMPLLAVPLALPPLAFVPTDDQIFKWAADWFLLCSIACMPNSISFSHHTHLDRAWDYAKAICTSMFGPNSFPGIRHYCSHFFCRLIHWQ